MKRKQIASVLLSFVMIAATLCTQFAQTPVYAAEEAAGEMAENKDSATEDTLTVNDRKEEEQYTESVTDGNEIDLSEKETDALDEVPDSQQGSGSEDDKETSDREASETITTEVNITEDVTHKNSEEENEEGTPLQDETKNGAADSRPDGITFRGIIPAATEEQKVIPENGTDKTSDDLFADYVENSFYGRIDQGSSGKKRLRKSAASNLSAIDRAIYDNISAVLPQIAAGERSSTVFEISVDELGLEKTCWTAEELGISSIFALDENGDIIIDDGGYVSFSEEAITTVNEKAAYSLSNIVNALLADHPYQLYWYDKTQNTQATGYTISGFYDDTAEDYVIAIVDSISISFPVARDYSAGEYLIDTSIGESVHTSVANANAIVEQYRGAADYEKLCGYKDEICNLVSYNDEAAASGVSYGNPWQMIWVFDGDPTTNVVCEGYSKAFKYLCDQTDFSKNIRCITVTGMMTGGTGEGPHMWNIAHLEDGNSYLVDLTNCDEGTIGAPDELFLAGYTSGNFETGYVFHCNGEDISYVYDKSTLNLYGDDELIISDSNYENAVEYIDNNIIYRIENDEAMVAGNTFDTTDALINVVIPDTINGFPVTSISGSAFYKCTSLESITLASSIRTIHDGHCDFDDSSMSYNMIAAFSHCTSLVSVTIPKESMLSYVGEYTFYGCTALSSIELPKSCERLALSSFEECASLRSLSIPSGMKYINQNALSGTGIKRLSLPAGLEYFDCWNSMRELEYIEIEEGNPNYRSQDGILYEHRYGWLKEDEWDWAVHIYPYQKTDNTYVVPDFITVFSAASILGEYMGGSTEEYYRFREYPKVIDIGKHELSKPFGTESALAVSSDNEYYTLRDGVLYSKDMTSLVCVPGDIVGELSIPETVTKIEACAAYRSKISSVDIPDNVIDIGEEAFSNCPNLTRIKFPKNVSGWGRNICSHCNKLNEFSFPDNINSLKGAVMGSTNIQRVVIPDSVDIIDSYCFYGCWSLESVEMPRGITEIEEFAFANTPITTLYIPMSVTSINDYAFLNTSLEKIIYEGSESQWNNITIGVGNDSLLNAEILCGGCPKNAHTLVHIDSVPATDENEGNIEYYRCTICRKLFSDENCENEITLEDTIIPVLLKVVTQPEDITAKVGEIVSLHVKTNRDDAVYQWQYSTTNGQSWKNCTSSGSNTETFSFRMNEILNQRMYRCRVTASDQELYSDAITVLLAEGLVIIVQPKDVEAAVGESVSLHVEANRADAVFQWQYSTTNGQNWKNCTSTGSNTETFSFRMNKILNQRMYRCRVTASDQELYSDAITVLLAEGLVITVQPKDVEAAVGESVSLHVEANRADAVFQWQYSTTNGQNWKNCTSTGSNTETFSFRMNVILNQRKYRCKVAVSGTELYTDIITVHLTE